MNTETLDKPTTANVLLETPEKSAKATLVTITRFGKEIESAMPDFGKAKYSAEMERLWEDSQKLFGFNSKQAEKFARHASADFGNATKSGTAKIKIGTVNGDNRANMIDTNKVDKALMTNALWIVRAIQWCKDAEKNGISYGFTDWKLSVMAEELQKYVASL